MKTKPGALPDLAAEILGSPLCTACGACTGYCPYIVAREDRVACVAECRRVQGRCYRNCPRSEGMRDGVLGGDAGYQGPVGMLQEALMARATGDSTPGGRQHGGVVSALMALALETDMIDVAILTRWREGRPETFAATSAAQVLGAAGSKFAVAPTAEQVNRALKQGYRRIGVVALPCQSTALRKMTLPSPDDGTAGEEAETGGIALILGLFCTWSLTQRGWLALLRSADCEWPPRRVDIPPPPAAVMEIDTTDGRRVQIPLDTVRAEIRPACRVCTDMTSENADLSVGLVEGIDGWNTVLARTERGVELVRRAREAGTLETESLAAERLAHLGQASQLKKRRAVAEAETLRAQAEPSGSGQPYLERLLAMGQEMEEAEVENHGR